MEKQFGEDFLEHVQDRLSEDHGFHSFSFLSQGTGTVALLGKSDDHLAVIRLTAHPHSNMGHVSFYDDTHRSAFPGLLQDVAAPTEYGEYMQAEVLPFGQIVDLSDDERETYRRSLDALTEGTVFKPAPNEVMVLPNGTPLLFDPGEIPYSDAYKEMDVEDQIAAEQASLAVVQDRLDRWDIPDILKFSSDDSGLKQDQFFAPHNGGSMVAQGLDVPPEP